MKEIITLSVFGGIFAVLAFLSRNVGQQKEPLKYTQGVVEGSYSDDGIRYYTISFDENGIRREGKSVGYRRSANRLIPEGTTVNIGYYETKAGFARVIIQDDGMTSMDVSARKFPKWLRRISIGFFAAAGYFVFRNMH